MRKKIILTMLVTAVLAFTACGKEAAPAATTAETTETTVAAETTAAAESTEAAEAGTEETKTEEGMVVDAAMNSLSILTLAGTYDMFSYPSEGAETDLEDGVLLGDVVKVEYTGNVEEGSAVAQKLSKASIETTLPREAYEFALSVLSCAKFNDLEGMSELVSYPTYVGVGDESMTIETKEDFAAIDREKLVPLEELGDFNLFNMTESKAGIVIGDAKPNIIFGKTDDGYGITGINIAAEE